MSNKNHRSAITGRYVTERYANSHPKTTVSEKKPPSGGGGKGKKGK